MELLEQLLQVIWRVENDYKKIENIKYLFKYNIIIKQKTG